ncbi:MAG: RNA polymerase sigma factor [Saprospiraceae bacterium]
MLKFLRPASLENTPDDELLRRYVSGGDVRALGTLYERYMPMVYGVCLKILRDPQKSEDAVMAIYEELTRKTREHEVGSFRGWLYVLARNHCLMEWRKNQRRPTDHHAPENMVRFDAVEEAFEVEISGGPSPLERCLAGLPDHQRRAVQLFYYDDKSYKEISEMLPLDLGLVRSHIQNGRRNLKICLEKIGVAG